MWHLFSEYCHACTIADHDNLVQALDTVRNVALAVNDSMDDIDDRLRVMQIQSNFITSHVSQYGLGFVPLKV
jgi:prophage DNA circulation protein